MNLKQEVRAAWVAQEIKRLWPKAGAKPGRARDGAQRAFKTERPPRAALQAAAATLRDANQKFQALLAQLAAAEDACEKAQRAFLKAGGDEDAMFAILDEK